MNGEATLAVSVAVQKDGRFLLVRRGRAPAHGLFAFPGGRVEDGETPEQAARRELMEETGVTAGKLAFVEELALDGENGDGPARYRLRVFTAALAGGTPRPGDDAEEAGWYALDAIRALPATATTLAIAERLAASREA